MADVVNKSYYVRLIFQIPETYVMSRFEEKKLYNYLLKATMWQETHWFRFLDCAAFCREEFCFFCSGDCIYRNVPKYRNELEIPKRTIKYIGKCCFHS